MTRSDSVGRARLRGREEVTGTTTHLHTCSLCEASCGIVVTTDEGRVTDIRGDKDDPHSRGFICPKARALSDIYDDPDRLRRPIVRTDDGWVEVGWEEAFDLVARRIREVRRTYGRDAVAAYQGNPSAHNLGLLTVGQLLFRGLRTRSLFSTSSVDQLPHMVASYLMFGHQWMLPVPDIDRTDLFICMGANPAVSNGSLMTAPNVKGRLKSVRERGGRVVIIDPRRTESAALADEHLAIRPGSDALLLLSMTHVLFDEHLVRVTRPAVGVDELGGVAAEFAPEITEVATGVEPEVVRRLARSLAKTERAVIYGRVGLSTQEFGGLCGWLLIALNALTGHLDEVGGAMFTTPAVDVLRVSSALGAGGSYATYRSRVRGLPEMGGELPAAVLAEEIETAGARQIRALIMSAGNPVLSSPNGARLERALPTLDFMVAVDWYVNETTRFADVILPPTAHLERSHYDALFLSFAVHNTAKYAPPVFERADDQRHDWEISVELLTRIIRMPVISRLARQLLLRSGPEGILRLALATGPHGLRRGGVSLRRLRRSPHGIDLGPLEPRLPGLLRTPGRKVQLAPQQFLADLPRLRSRLEKWSTRPEGLVLIGRRHLRSNNSWMHNSRSLMEGRGHPTCTLMINPRDASVLNLTNGEVARVISTTGSIAAPVEVSDAVMPGVVSLPHGWGHHRSGAQLRVAGRQPGVSINDVTDDQFVDVLTGTAVLSGIPVRVSAVEQG